MQNLVRPDQINQNRLYPSRGVLVWSVRIRRQHMCIMSKDFILVELSLLGLF